MKYLKKLSLADIIEKQLIQGILKNRIILIVRLMRANQIFIKISSIMITNLTIRIDLKTIQILNHKIIMSINNFNFQIK
jgi:hypothetical protein